MEATNSIILGEDTGGKGRVFQSRFLQAGLVKYSFGVCLLTKETINKFVNSFIGCPVRIDHKDITDENAKDERVGVVSDIWFNDADGWFWCKGVIFDDKAIDLIKNGYNVSCQYEITEYSDNIENKLHNGIPYDKEILNGKFEHLAIVDNPRYEGALIAVNAIAYNAEFKESEHPRDEEGKFTSGGGSKGTTQPKDIEKYISQGYEAIPYFKSDKLSKKEKGYKLYKGDVDAFKLNEGDIEISPEEYEKYTKFNKERLEKQKELEAEDFRYLKLTGKNPKRDTWKLATEYVLKKRKATNEYKPILDYIENYDERNETMNEETKNVFERLISALKAKNEADDKDKKAENEDVDKRDIIRQIMAIAGKEEASEDVKTIAKLAEKLAYDKSEAGTADNKAKNEEKEEKDKEADNCRAKNDKVDKRELIDQVGGILKGKVDDEIIRTVIGKLEEIAYDKSEAGTADNKAKNDDDEYKKLKDDVEKDVENCKAKNSMDALKELFYTGEVKQEKSYMSQKERIELGKQLF